MTIVPRKFTELNPTPAGTFSVALPLSAFLDRSAMVVLGDPGMGKTTSFEEAANREDGAKYVKVRDFLTFSTGQYKQRTLYLDGLDEMRAADGDGISVLDRIRGKLDALGRPQFRLSCRSTDWYGNSDLDSLAAVAPDGAIALLQLEPLSEPDIITIARDKIDDPTSFAQEATNRGVYELATNPQTLVMLLSVIKADGAWPTTRRKLFERACELLALERNDLHARRKGARRLGSPQILDAAGMLCAVLLCADVAGFSLTEGNADAVHPWIADLTGDPAPLEVAARRRIFRSTGAERVTYAHRTIAEFLGARYLVDRVRHGLPVGRVLSLLVGSDGGTLSELRGLYAWLACLYPEEAVSLLRRDPLGITLYGDVAVMGPSEKKLLIEALAELASRDPWFRAQDWNSHPFGALATSDTAPMLQAILEDRSQVPHLVSCALAAIRHGPELPGMGSLLLAFATDETRPTFLRKEALPAFYDSQPTQRHELRNLLDRMQQGQVQDDGYELREVLLKLLYPREIKPAEVSHYLEIPSRRNAGAYDVFLRHHLIERTPPAEIPSILDTIVRSGRPKPTTSSGWRASFLAQLIARGLDVVGEDVTTNRLYGWLSITLDEHDLQVVQGAESKKIRDWFQGHPKIVCDLYEHWLSLAPVDQLDRNDYEFWRRLHHATAPAELVDRLLARAEKEGSTSLGTFMFQRAVEFAWWAAADAITLDHLFEYVDRNQGFRALLESLAVREIPPWRLDDARRHAKEKRGSDDARTRRVEDLQDRMEGIQAGEGVADLIYLARLYLGHLGQFGNSEGEVEPAARLAATTNFEIAEATKGGFVASLSKLKFPPPTEIGRKSAKSRSLYIGYLVLAGMDILASRSERDLLRLPKDTLLSAVAFHYANDQGKDRGWIAFLVREVPTVVTEALEAYWAPQLPRGKSHVSGIYGLAHGDTLEPIAGYVTARQLRPYPNCRLQELGYLLEAALKHLDPPDFLTLAREVLSRKGAVRGKQRALWLAGAFMRAPQEFGPPLYSLLRSDRERIGVAMGFIRPDDPRHRRGESPSLPADSLSLLIRLAGRHYPPTSWPRQGDVGDITAAHNVSDAIRGLINTLATDPSPEATEVLNRLVADFSLDNWRDHLAHALAVQTQNRREAWFKRPAVVEVVHTLAGGQPSSGADLQALVVHHLRDIGINLRHGNNDRYKDFWNEDSHKKPVDPKPEDSGRNCLLGFLRTKLLPLGLCCEPEGYYANSKRADIKVLWSGGNLPIEIKRHYHPDLWTAPERQLRKFYMQDPGACGRGIFVVLWFGADIRNVPTPPAGIPRPESAEAMEEALRAALPMDPSGSIDVVVLDVSRPRSVPRRTRRRTTQ